jgi:two-component system cell cycle sensor histidine kinase/response regulator CckA
VIRPDESLFRDLFDQAGIGMAVIDLAGRVVRSNRAFARIVGYPEAEIAALDPLALTHPDDDLRIRELVREFAAGSRKRLRIERRFVRRDGSIRWGRATVSIVHGTDGKAGCALALLEDVTGNHEIDGALREAEEICTSITGSSPDFIMIVELDGRIRFINRTIPQMTVAEAVGTTVFDHIPERFWPDVRAAFEQVVRSGQEGSYEVEYPAPDGKVHVFVSRVWPVRTDGEVTAFTICATDVTAQRLLERQLLHAQKMESIGRLAGGIAHDLNNQLSIILGAIELAQRNPATGAAVEAELCRVESAAERAAALTQQLLAFARRQVHTTRPMSPNSLVANVRDMVDRILGEDIRLRLHLGRVGQVRVDPVQMEQVMLNLVINARDAMPKGGTLVISTEEVAVGGGHASMPAGRYALFRVIDTGTGMDKETLARVFEPFFTTKEEGKGTGLGLAVARGIVTQSGGHIDVESTPGAGTTFRVFLPVVEDPVEPASEPARAAGRGTETIVVVEDDARLLDVLRRGLGEHGYRVLPATNGADALALLSSTPEVRILVTDVVMPGMDGQELASRATHERPDLKVILLSGYEIARRPEAGGHPLLRKPVSPAVLARAVREVLDGPLAARS